MDPVVVALLVFIAFCLFMVYYTSHKKSQAKKQITNLKKEKGATLFGTFTHFYGLPIAENILVQIFSSEDEYEFLAANTSFKLNKNKITDVSVTTDVEIQKSNVSSIGGAVGGAILFGPIGAMIGGRSKEKTSRVVNSYLIFTYMDDNEIKYVAFNCTGNIAAHKFVKEFKQNNPKTNSTINL